MPITARVRGFGQTNTVTAEVVSTSQLARATTKIDLAFFINGNKIEGV
jgi:hypothetical protein